MLRKGDVVIDSLFIIACYTICNWVLIVIRSLCKSCLLNNKTVVFRISLWSYLSPFNNTTTLEGRSTANENSSFQFDQELGESAGLRPGLYKPAFPDPQHHTWANSSAATSARIGPPSPTRNLAASSAGNRTRTGIIYPLQPRSRRPDVCIQVEAALPEPAALLLPDPHPPTREVPTSLPRTSRRLSRKRRRNRSSAIYRPAKRSPLRGHWCDRL